jgi:hypothetical protein
MPYRSQGIATAEGSKRIELSYLFKNKLIQKNQNIRCEYYWNNRGEKTGSIGIETMFNDSEKWIRLYYTISYNQGTKKDFDYKINLEPVKSNLGRGNVYYFECPETLNRCRILYKAYGSEIFKSRGAYMRPVYYIYQALSKKSYYLQRHFDLNEKLKKLYYQKRYFKESYRGHITRAFQRVENLEKKRHYFDIKCLISIQEKLNKFHNKQNGNSTK